MKRFALLAILALASCDSGEVPTPSEAQVLRPSTPEVAENEVVLRGDGLIAGTEAFYYAAGQNEVEAAIAATLGKPGDVSDMDECGAGPMQSSSYPGGLTINYQNGTLVGWFWDEEAETISLDADYGVGSTRAEIVAEDGFTPIEDSTLGEEFSIGERLGGFIEQDKVSMLYSGTQCFFR